VPREARIAVAGDHHAVEIRRPLLDHLEHRDSSELLLVVSLDGTGPQHWYTVSISVSPGAYWRAYRSMSCVTSSLVFGLITRMRISLLSVSRHFGSVARYYASKDSSARASTRAPSSQRSGSVNSSGEWLMPFRLGTNSIPAGT
jgi:hypothetical protein